MQFQCKSNLSLCLRILIDAFLTHLFRDHLFLNLIVLDPSAQISLAVVNSLIRIQLLFVSNLNMCLYVLLDIVLISRNNDRLFLCVLISSTSKRKRFGSLQPIHFHATSIAQKTKTLSIVFLDMMFFRMSRNIPKQNANMYKCYVG